MERFEQLKFCSICIHQKDGMRSGIICGITNQIAPAAYVAGGVEGVVKSYYGGPDVEFGSSIFGNPISDAGMTISSNSWTLLGMATYP